MERIRAGQRVILCGSDAAAVAEEWRDVAKQYQSAFEQNESCVYIVKENYSEVLLTIPSWVQSHSGVSVTGAVDVVVPVDDLRAEYKTVQIALDAIKDVRFCEKLFNEWMTELDKCVANPFSRHRVPSNDNNGFTESQATPRSETAENRG